MYWRRHTSRVVYRKSYSRRVRRYPEVSDYCWPSMPEYAMAACATCSSPAGNSGSLRGRIPAKAMAKARLPDNTGARARPPAMWWSVADALCRSGRRVRVQRLHSPKRRPRPITKGRAPALRILACVSLIPNASRIHCCLTRKYTSVMSVTGLAGISCVSGHLRPH